MKKLIKLIIVVAAGAIIYLYAMDGHDKERKEVEKAYKEVVTKTKKAIPDTIPTEKVKKVIEVIRE